MARCIFGKCVFDTFGEILDARHTAVLVVDMQRTGHTDRSCCEQTRDESMVDAMAPKLATLISHGRAAGVTVVWIYNAPEDNRAIWNNPDPQIDAMLSPLPGEVVMIKKQANAFIGTNLEIDLRRLGIRSTITTGITTEGCVESTAEGAGHRDFYSVVAEECIASFDRELHEAALAILRYRCDVATTNAITAEWTNRERGPRAARPSSVHSGSRSGFPSEDPE